MCPPGQHQNHPVGESHGMAKLSDDAVRVIRETDGSTKELAAHFGVSERLVRYVRSGRVWRHL